MVKSYAAIGGTKRQGCGGMNDNFNTIYIRSVVLLI